MGAVDIALAQAQARRRGRRQPPPVPSVAASVAGGIGATPGRGRAVPVITPDTRLSQRMPSYQGEIEGLADAFRRSVRRRARRGPMLLPAREATAVARPITPKEAAYHDYMRQIGASWAPPEDPVAADLERYAPTGVRIVRALTGDQPGALTPTVSEFANVGAALAGGGGLKVLSPVARAAGSRGVTTLARAGAAAKREADELAVGTQLRLSALRQRYADSARGIPPKRPAPRDGPRPLGKLGDRLDRAAEREWRRRQAHPTYDRARRLMDAYKGLRLDVGAQAFRRHPEIMFPILLQALLNPREEDDDDALVRVGRR